MTLPQDDLTQTKAAAVCLAVCIVQTLNESDPTLRARFCEALGRAYQVFRDQGGGVAGTEVFSWTKEMLLGRVNVGRVTDSDSTARKTASILPWIKTNTWRDVGGAEPSVADGTGIRTDGSQRAKSRRT